MWICLEVFGGFLSGGYLEWFLGELLGFDLYVAFAFDYGVLWFVWLAWANFDGNWL